MTQRFSNNAATTLAQALSAGGTSLVVASGAAFPVLGAGEYFLVTLIERDENGNETAWEIVKVVEVMTGNVWLIERAQEGTPARSWGVATRVELRATAGSLEAFLQPTDIGTTVCAQTDPRLSDARTPTSHIHGNLTNDGKVGAVSGKPLITGTGGTVQAGSFGTTSGTFCQGDDSRLSNARTPTAHKSTHATGGSDALTPADIGAATAAQGAKADTALQPSAIGTTVQAFTQGASLTEMELGVEGGARTMSPYFVSKAIRAQTHPILHTLQRAEMSATWGGAEAVRTTLGGSLTGTSKWMGGVLAPGGNIMAIPFDSTDVLIISPTNHTATRTNLGASLTGSGKWYGGVLSGNGTIYGIPHNASDILVITPHTGVATRWNPSLSNMTATSKWRGGVASPTGLLCGVPFDAQDILMINPFTGTASRSNMGAAMSGSNKWIGGVLAPNGWIFCIPFNATSVLAINAEASSAVLTDFGISLSGTNKWAGGVLGPDGKIYCIPYSATDILVIDPLTWSATRLAMGASLSGSAKWVGGVLGPNGRIYGIPFTATDVLLINPANGTAGRGAFGMSGTGSSKWCGGVLSYHNRFYGIPLDSTDIFQVDMRCAPLEAQTCLSPYLNKM
ncbi:hypothetical protein HW932_01945 [Allochromatium humboldtianum]|uniref:Uncharacterized protein n=1 Tax=Allochromatium humboldtianum TaxID=504901 RepID=A0A850RED1_9GAMM|nr:hypothetical protein [Allochromatium humboldtianum]NVZ08021.1 hypothetical protein [Allochromatium humboldtianum]